MNDRELEFNVASCNALFATPCLQRLVCNALFATPCLQRPVCNALKGQQAPSPGQRPG